jgi:hypothetical protein
VTGGRKNLVPCLFALSALVPATAGANGSEVVYVANYANSLVLRVDFDAGTATAINTDANNVKKLSSLYVRNDGNIDIVVCDSQAGNVLIYENVESPTFDGRSQVITSVPSPDGISADAAGNLYLISSGLGSRRGTKQVWFIEKGGLKPGGYFDAQLVGEVEAKTLEDTKVVKTAGGDLQAGDILVLSRDPARVLRFRPSGLGWTLVNGPGNPFITFSAGIEPMGIAFSAGAAGSEILVLTSDGGVLRYSFSGTLIPAAFLPSGLGNGTFKIATGLQAGANRAFITQRNGHKVYAFNILADGSAAAVASVSGGLSFPQGVGIGTGNGAFVPRAAEVTAAFDSQTSTFNNGRQAGIVDVSCRFLGADPREFASPPLCEASCDVECEGSFCPRSLFLDELDASLAHAEVPSYFRFFQRNGPGAGPAKPFLCVAKSSAKFSFASILFEADDVLSWPGHAEPQCGPGPDPADHRANFAWTPIPGTSEPPIYEGGKFINLSTGCGNSNRGNVDDYSYYLPVLRDTRPISAVAENELVGIKGTLNCLAASIDDPVETTLRQKAAQAAGAFFRFNKCGNPDAKTAALQRLAELQQVLTDNTNDADCDGGAAGDAFNDCSRNVSGELRVRAQAAVWFVTNTDAPAEPDPCCGAAPGACGAPPEPDTCPFP